MKRTCKPLYKVVCTCCLGGHVDQRRLVTCRTQTILWKCKLRANLAASHPTCTANAQAARTFRFGPFEIARFTSDPGIKWPHAATKMCPKTATFLPKITLPRCSAVSPDTPGNVHHLLTFHIKAYDYKSEELVVSYTGPAYLFVAEGFEGEVFCVQQNDRNVPGYSDYQAAPSVAEPQISSEVWLDPDDNNLFQTPPPDEAGSSSFGVLDGSVQTVAVQESYLSDFNESTLGAPVVYTDVKELNAGTNELSPILKESDVDLSKDCSVLLSQLSNEIVHKKLTVQNDLNEYNNDTDYINNSDVYDNETLLELLTSNKANAVEETQTILYFNEGDDYGHDLQYIDPKNFEFTNDDVSKYMEDSLDDIPLTAYTSTPNILKKKTYPCDLCDAAFPNLAKRRSHVKTDHNDNSINLKDKYVESFDCDECQRKFSCRERWISHKKAHGDPDLECTICRKVLGSKQSLKGHLKIHERKFKCGFCTRTYETDILMRSHVSKKHGMLKCSQCDFECHTTEEHNLHKESHQAIENIPDFDEIIEQTIIDERIIEENHTEEHLGDDLLEDIIEDDIIDPNPGEDFFPTYFAEDVEEEEEYCEDENEEVYEEVNTVTDHKQQRAQFGTAYEVITKIINTEAKHKKKIKRDCVMCHKHFDRTSDYKRHIIEHVVQETRPTPDTSKGTPVFRCQLCNEGRFCRVDKLKAHLRQHLELRLYQCHLCNKTFSDSSNYSKHKKVHGSKVFQCEICNRKFNTKKMTAQHMEYHTKTKPLNCKQCGKVFYFMSNLKKHCNVIHKMNVRGSYSCQICHMKFKSMKLKWDHQWVEHSVRKRVVDCSTCHAMFRKYSELKKHCKDVHGQTMGNRNIFFGRA